MGTNYYLKTKPCDTCGHRMEELHIGKSSGGWQFHFRGYMEEEITSYKKWLEIIENSGKEIMDEYGDVISIEQFKELVASKKDGLNHTNIVTCKPETKEKRDHLLKYENSRHYYDMDVRDDWKDNEGHAFTGREFC